MTALETVEEILDLAKGRKATGGVFHKPCGTRMAWSLSQDKALCTTCIVSWPRGPLEAFQKQLKAGAGGVTQANIVQMYPVEILP